MLTIISALKSEISPLLQRVCIAEKIKLGSGSLYLSENFHFLRTGIGPEKAGKVLKLYLKQFKPHKILNIGLAGKLNPDLNLGEIYSISKIFFEDNFPIEIAYQQKINFVSLLTVDQPVTAASLRNELFKKFNSDLVDMEAYSLAEICIENSLHFESIKIISDEADSRTKITFIKNYKRLASRLAEFIWQSEIKKAMQKSTSPEI